MVSAGYSVELSYSTDYDYEWGLAPLTFVDKLFTCIYQNGDWKDYEWVNFLGCPDWSCQFSNKS